MVLLLLAMMLPVCHLHPLLEKGAPDHCTICLTLHLAAPLGVHLQRSVSLRNAGQIVLAAVPITLGLTPQFTSTRAPPSSAC